MFSKTRVMTICWTVVAVVIGSEGLAAAEIRCRVIDADTDRSLPCRVYVRSDADTWHFARSASPKGTAVKYDVARSATSFEKHTTVSAHPFVVDVPPGRYTVVVERGKEYHPTKLVLQVGHHNVERTIELHRWIDMAQHGWYSGDTHVHRSLEELPNVMLAEDLNVAVPLTYWVRQAHRKPAEGEESAEAEPRLIEVDAEHVIWPINTEYELFSVAGGRHTLGAVFVLNHQQPLEVSAPPVAPVAEAARKQGALLDLDKHSWPWSLMLVPVMDVDLFELSNNHIWRTAFYFRGWTRDHLPRGWDVESDDEGFTEWGWIDFGFKTYYGLLNCGFRMRPTAGTASGVHPVPLGYGRVYVHLPEGFSYRKWIAALDAGRSFVTTGPMLFATFNGSPAGTTIESEGPTSVRVRGHVRSGRPLSRIDIVRNGEVVEIVSAANDYLGRNTWRTQFDQRVSIARSSWLAVRCFEGQPPGDRLRFAHTGVVHVEIPNRPLRPRKRETAFFIRRMKDEIQRNQGVLTDPELAEYEQALQVYCKLHAEAVARPRTTTADLKELVPPAESLPEAYRLRPVEGDEAVELPANPLVASNPLYVGETDETVFKSRDGQRDDNIRLALVAAFFKPEPKAGITLAAAVCTDETSAQAAEAALQARFADRKQSLRTWQRRDLVVALWPEPQATEVAIDAFASHIQNVLDAQ